MDQVLTTAGNALEKVPGGVNGLLDSLDSDTTTMGVIKKVWIEEGCISCNVCQDVAPEVFRVEDGEDCVIKADAPKSFVSKDEEIRDATLDCPVEVIRFAEK